MSYEKEEMIPFTIEESQSYQGKKFCYISKKEFSIMIVKIKKTIKIKNIKRLEIIVIILEYIEQLRMIFSIWGTKQKN